MFHLRIFVFAAAAALVLAWKNDGRSQDLIEKLIDEIVAESLVEESPSKSTAPAKSSNVRTLPDGTTIELRPNGTQVVTKPDGTKHYIDREGRKVTIRPNGERVFQAPGDPPVTRPPRAPVPDPPSGEGRPIDSPEPRTRLHPAATRTHVGASNDSTAEPQQFGTRSPVGEHAKWEELERGLDWVHSRSHALDNGDVVDARTDRARDAAGREFEDGAGSNTTVDLTPNSSAINRPPTPFEFATNGGARFKINEAGFNEALLPDGTKILTMPGGGQASVRRPGGGTFEVDADPDGSIRINAGQTKYRFDPSSNKTYIEYPDGAREVVNSDGHWGSSDPWLTGYYNRDGKLLEAIAGTETPGVTVRFEDDGVAVMYRNGEPIGPAKFENGYWKASGPDGEYKASAIARPSSSSTSEPTRSQFNIFERNSQAIQDWAKSRERSQPGTLENVPRRTEQPDGSPTRPGAGVRESDLAKFLRIVQAQAATTPQGKSKGETRPEESAAAADRPPKTSAAASPPDLRDLEANVARKQQLEAELERAQELVQKQTRSLNDEVDLLRRETKQLEREIATLRQSAQEDDLSLSVSRNGVRQREIVLNAANDRLRVQERSMADEIAGALKRVDYNAYNRCPESQNWKDCGHAEIKKAWLNEQLARILGRSFMDRYRNLKAEQETLAQELASLKTEDEKLKEKENVLKKKKAEINRKSEALSKAKESLGARERDVRRRLDDQKSQVANLEKQVGELDDAIRKAREATTATP